MPISHLDSTIEKNRRFELVNKFIKFRKLKYKKYQYLRYGLTPEEVLTMKKAQEYRCAICKKEFESSRKTHVDHDHYTLKIRGLLCTNCNLGLGQFKDDIQSLENAVEYLKHAETP